ncbi:MAG: histidinol dehydrogenase [Planctomycetaceae bacterium]|nr:histidinol dehydrogenase [Planctomycetaceae bacterium]
MLTRLDTSARDFEERLDELRKKLSPDGTVVSERSAQLTMSLFGEAISPQQVVERICREVRIQGTQAVLKYARALDDPRMDASRLRVPSERMVEAHKAVAPEFLQAVRAIRNNIARFQQAILHKDVELTDGLGQVLKQRYRPLERIGICVPGGAAAYPSTVLMTAVPAQIAGVKQIAIMAPPVDMIVGPGNLFVALAKRLVYGTVAIDSIAGPSEVVVIADRTTKSPNAASDLIAQAEHSPGSSIVLSSDAKMLDQIDEQIQLQLTRLERAELAKDSLIKFGASILCDSEQEVVRICDRLAPEHLQISVDDPDRYSSQIRNAGAIFKGHYSPVALGDYAAGPSHVLPTGGTARWASGLSANHFLRSYSEVEFTLDGLRAIEPHVTQLADKEGLTAHRQSVKIRLD